MSLPSLNVVLAEVSENEDTQRLYSPGDSFGNESFEDSNDLDNASADLTHDDSTLEKTVEIALSLDTANNTRWHCSCCPYYAVSYFDLEGHYLSTHQPRPFQCDTHAHKFVVDSYLV